MSWVEKTVIGVLIGLTLYVMLRGVITFKKRRKNTEKKKLYLSLAAPAMGLIGSFVFLALGIWAAIGNAIFWLVFLFLLLGFACSLLILVWKNIVIAYDAEGITATNFWGKKRRLLFSQLSGFKGKLGVTDIRLCFGKQSVLIDKMTLDMEQLYLLAHNKYRAAHHGKTLPDLQKDAKGFRANVTMPYMHYAAYCIAALCGAVCICFAVYLLVAVKTEDDFTPVTIVCTSVNEKNAVVEFCADGYKEPFRLQKRVSGDTTAELLVGQELNLLICEEEEYFLVGRLSINGWLHYDIDDLNQALIRGWSWYVVAIFAMGLLFLQFPIVSLHIGRHPERYSDRIVHIYFKKGRVKGH